MKRKRGWFFTTTQDGENPAVMLGSLMLGMALASVVIWLIAGAPALSIPTPY